MLICSGQACVLYGIADFSKDGDWIVREDTRSCRAVVDVLAAKKARYRLGAPLDVRWLKEGWTSHFEYKTGTGFRCRVDFFSRPPRILDVDAMWQHAIHDGDVSILDIEDLIKMKRTQRLKDYPIIGALAEVGGLEIGEPRIALNYLQDFDLLKDAVTTWPDAAAACRRNAVQLICAAADRAAVVNAIAQEQDQHIQEDRSRLQRMKDIQGDYPDIFRQAQKRWIVDGTDLNAQHTELVALARGLIES